MTDHPIIFSAQMVSALLDGSKTQTRRLAKFPKGARDPEGEGWEASTIGGAGSFRTTKTGYEAVPKQPCIWNTDDGMSISPQWQIGDRLWVRESHVMLPRTAYRGSIGTGTIDQREHPTDGYTAAVFREGFDRSGKKQWRPSIHMPRWASRLTLTVTEVRAQRLSEIGEADARAEGFSDAVLDDGFALTDKDGTTITSPGTFASAAGMFQIYWAKLHPDWDGFSDPWVWALTFDVARKNIDEERAA